MRRIEKGLRKWPKIFSKSFSHTPVMREEIVTYLQPENKKYIVDCTLGLGGHSRRILERMNPDGVVIGLDRDEESLKLAEEKLSDYRNRIFIFNSDFSNIDSILAGLRIKKADGFLFDLGMSSFQLSLSERGFSFLKEGLLDMRMNRRDLISAYDLVNNLSERELSFIFREFGQEKWHSRIARLIVEERRKMPIVTTLQLAELIEKHIAFRSYSSYIHSAARIFQALRIAVNHELEFLEVALEKSLRLLNEKGRICIISFHSLEDKIIKKIFKKAIASGEYFLITAKPLHVSTSEEIDNSYSRAARLRVIERR
ncbi:MAG: 16S rRNA (cytosine(1402)-N(4))-methyltransferase RsmH [Candidatus Omnitrophica bacterium]|nr:16S rRNA (cytosine(1402)-N(4))-methyltransferase RsmH [Candidatus Omnitrophota bacterium]